MVLLKCGHKPRIGKPEPRPRARPVGGAQYKVSGGQALKHGSRLGAAQNNYMDLPPCGPMTCRVRCQGWVWRKSGSRQGWGPRCADPWLHKLPLGTWNVTLLVEKEPELVQEMEQYQLDIDGLSSMHSTGCGTKLVDRTGLFFSGIAKSKRCQAGVGILTSPQLSASSYPLSNLRHRRNSVNSVLDME